MEYLLGLKDDELEKSLSTLMEKTSDHLIEAFEEAIDNEKQVRRTPRLDNVGFFGYCSGRPVTVKLESVSRAQDLMKL